MKRTRTNEWIIEDFSDEIKALLDKQKEKILEEWGLTAEGHAIQYETAIDTGRLRNSITHATHKKTGKPYTYKDREGNSYTGNLGSVPEDSVAIGTNVEYAPYIEYGARGRSGVHFLENAISKHTDEYKSILQKNLDTII